MIKIQPSGASATVLTSRYKKSVQGNFGGSVRQATFPMEKAELLVRWENTGIHAEIHALEEMYLKEIILLLKYRSPKPTSETAVWAETCLGSLFSKKKCGGSWAMWISESRNSEGLFFGQSYPATHLLSFKCQPLRRNFGITWLINCHIAKGQKIALTKVDIFYGAKDPLVEKWRKRSVSKDRKEGFLEHSKGWLGGTGINSLSDIHESLDGLKRAKIKPDWFAIGPGYAEIPGDWLVPKNEFQGKMNSLSRYIHEMNIMPGIQFAPYIVSRSSEIVRDKSEWLVGNEHGVPIRVKGYPDSRDVAYVLDITQPEVQQHIKSIFSNMRTRWKYRVFVLDRITDVAVPGRRENNARTLGELIEEAVANIRKIVGNQVLLVGMDLPLLTVRKGINIKVLTDVPGPATPPDALMKIASTMLRNAAWNNQAWSNASGPIPVNLFQNADNTAVATLLGSIAFATGTVIFSGSPGEIDNAAQERMKKFLEVFEECRAGRLSGSEQDGNRAKNVFVVRNDCGRLAVFNCSSRRREVCLIREVLKSNLGINTTISAGEGTRFNSPEVLLALPPRGHRIFRA